MTDIHNKSFFGQKVGMILSSRSKTDPFIFLKFLKKKANNEWEKPSKGEGKTIKISIEEMITIISVIYKKLPKWSGFHSFKEDKTSISLNWDERDELLWIRVDEYAKSLRFPQTEFLKLLIEHLIKEKISFATSGNTTYKKKESSAKNSEVFLESFESESFFENINDYSNTEDKKNIIEQYTKNSQNDKIKNNSKQVIKARIKKSTDKAILLIFGNGSEVWIPKSKIHCEFDPKQNSYQQEFFIESWILEKKNIL